MQSDLSDMDSVNYPTSNNRGEVLLFFVYKSYNIILIPRYWTYANRTLVQGPSNLTELNLPSEAHSMDAAVEWGANGELYIFKGNKFWRYNSERTSIDPGYPKTIHSVLPDLPNHVNAALQWKNGKTYFFKGTQYYALDDASIQIQRGYPKSVSTYWMGCSPAGLRSGKISPYRSSKHARDSSFANKAEFIVIVGSFITLFLIA